MRLQETKPYLGDRRKARNRMPEPLEPSLTHDSGVSVKNNRATG